MSALRTRRAAPRRDSEQIPERPLVSLIRVVLLFESAMYSAVSPVLPHYAHTLHASKPAIGVLAAAYPAGLIPGALLGFWVATRVGVRRTTSLGLSVFGLAVIAFGFGTSIVMLDVLRVIQGIFCGLIWCGGLTWVIYATPVRRRSRTLGGVLGAATLGTLFGPIIGTGAVAVGTRPAFAVVGLLALGLAAATLRHPDAHPAASDQVRTVRGQLRDALRSRGLRLGVWLIGLEAVTFGAENALLPLRLSHFGASGLTIGLTFVLASGISAALSTVVGHITDRRGPYLPLIAGLVVGAPLMALLVVPQTPLVLAALMVVTFGAPLTFSMIPAASLMTESAEAVGVSLVLATTLFNLAYALGETIGAPVSASVAQSTSDFVPLLAIALLMLATAGWALTHRVSPGARRGRHRPPPGPRAPEPRPADSEPPGPRTPRPSPEPQPQPQPDAVSASRGTPSSSAAAASDISTYRSGVCSESPSTMCTASPSVNADSRSATSDGSGTDHSPVSHP
jgi:predicted MFS family arabinose efflux permease